MFHLLFVTLKLAHLKLPMYIGQLRAYILPSIILPSDMNVLQKISVQKNKGLRTLKEFSFG